PRVQKPPPRPMRIFAPVVRPLAFVLLCTACARATPPDATADGRTRLVFVHQPLGDPRALDALLDDFRRAHPELAPTTQLLPNDADVAHQYFLTALEGAAADLDLFVIDIVWVAEL